MTTSRKRLTLLVLVLLCLPAAFAGRAAATRERARRSLPLGTRAALFARHLVGVPYAWGGTSPRTGFDCSGFVRFVYERFGVSLPHSSYAQWGSGRPVSRLRPGDLVFFDGDGHVGLYIGDGRFIHAPHSGTRVSIDSLGAYRGSYDGARRIAPA